MIVNSINAIDYSNINKERTIGRTIGRTLGRTIGYRPSFGEIGNVAKQAVRDEFNSSVNIAKQQRTDIVSSNPINALSGKFNGFLEMFTPKTREEGRKLQKTIDYYFSLSSNNILNKIN